MLGQNVIFFGTRNYAHFLSTVYLERFCYDLSEYMQKTRFARKATPRKRCVILRLSFFVYICDSAHKKAVLRYISKIVISLGFIFAKLLLLQWGARNFLQDRGQPCLGRYYVDKLYSSNFHGFFRNSVCFYFSMPQVANSLSLCFNSGNLSTKFILQLHLFRFDACRVLC